MLKKIAGLGVISFWVMISFVRLALFTVDDVSETFSLTEYALVEKEVVEPVAEPIVECAEVVECEYTEEEIKLMVRLAMSEAGKLSVDAIQGVVQTAMNRVKSDDYPDTITGVIYQRINGHPQFSTADNGEPNWKCEEAVRNAIASPEAFPTDMYWFNSIHTPNYGHYYTEIDGMYFSTETDYHKEVADDLLY